MRHHRTPLCRAVRRLSATLAGVVALLMVSLPSTLTATRQPSPASSQTQVVLLGTGNPPADPDRSGPATAVVVNGTPYLVDFGAGIVRRAKSAAVDKGIAALDTADRSIVISGDTNPTQAAIDACHGCDVLIHEVLTLEWLAKRPDFHAYAAQFHTTTTQLVDLATKAKPRLLILYHGSLSLRPAVDSERSTPAAMLREMSRYAGQVVIGRDLDVY
jgi:ribonuclease BN (tRNA processing enzyme)